MWKTCTRRNLCPEFYEKGCIPRPKPLRILEAHAGRIQPRGGWRMIAVMQFDFRGTARDRAI
jgi:hypothetical protein